jgi:hypothetical protein
MDKKRFDDAIGEAPPSTVDVGAAIARGRRAARIRGAAIPGLGVAAVVLTVGAVTFTTSWGPGSVPAGSPPPTPPPVICGYGPDAGPPERIDASKERLTSLIRDLVRHRLPSGARVAESDSMDTLGDAYEPLEFYGGADDVDVMPVACDPHTSFHAEASIHLGGAANQFFVGLESHLEVSSTLSCAPDEDMSSPELPPEFQGLPVEKGDTVCEESVGSGGERVRAVVTKHQDSESLDATVLKPDGTSIQILLTNGNVNNTPAPPMTVDQLVEIALDPRLTLFR